MMTVLAVVLTKSGPSQPCGNRGHAMSTYENYDKISATNERRGGQAFGCSALRGCLRAHHRLPLRRLAAVGCETGNYVLSGGEACADGRRSVLGQGRVRLHYDNVTNNAALRAPCLRLARHEHQIEGSYSP